MTTPSRRSDTAIEGISGLRPEVPALWSYSSLTTLEACPRRWMLERADYPRYGMGAGTQSPRFAPPWLEATCIWRLVISLSTATEWYPLRS